MQGFTRFFGAIGALTLGAAQAHAYVLDFQTIDTAGPQYAVGTVFNQGGSVASLSEFTLNEGGTVSNGRARRVFFGPSIPTLNYALTLNNVTLNLALPSGGVGGFSFNTSLPRGFINLSVNGVSTIIDGATIDGLSIGGVTFASTLTGADDPALRSLVTASGVVESFSIGGSGLTVDNFSGSPAPSPGTGLMLIGSAGLGALRRRR